MRINQAGVDLVKSFEACSLQAYRCPAGKLTVGFGHTGPDVKEGMRITPDQADDLLAIDLASFGFGVHKLLQRQPTPNQFAAMVSLAYNIGLDAFEKSTLLKHFNEGDPIRAAAEFMRWVYVKGVKSRGLIARRKQERALFLGFV